MAQDLGVTAFEDLRPGYSVQAEVEVPVEAVQAFAHLTGDSNPLHHDAPFARRLGFPGAIVHGSLLAAFVTALVGERLPGPGSVIHGLTLDFLEPAHPGDRLLISAEVTQISEAVRTVVLKVAVRRATVTLARGRVQVGLPLPATVILPPPGVAREETK